MKIFDQDGRVPGSTATSEKHASERAADATSQPNPLTPGASPMASSAREEAARKAPGASATAETKDEATEPTDFDIIFCCVLVT